MKIRSLLTILCLGLASQVGAAVTFHTDDSLKVLAINGHEIKAGFLKVNQYTLEAGSADIEVRYEQIFEDFSNDAHDIVKSKPFYLTLDELQDGQSYYLKVANEPNTLDEARQFIKQPTGIAVYNAQGQLIKQHLHYQKKDQASGQQGFFSRHYDVRQAPNTKVSAPIAQHQQMTTAPSQSAVTESNTLQQLKSLWLNTTEQDKVKFLLWLNQSQ